MLLSLGRDKDWPTCYGPANQFAAFKPHGPSPLAVSGSSGKERLVNIKLQESDDLVLQVS